MSEPTVIECSWPTTLPPIDWKEHAKRYTDALHAISTASLDAATAMQASRAMFELMARRA